jgi:hypothetical protein
MLATTKDRLYYWYDDITLDDMVELYAARDGDWRAVRERLFELRRRHAPSAADVRRHIEAANSRHGGKRRSNSNDEL